MNPRIPILLISYVFPPYYGIGGRRWARHAHELTRLGYTVHVICAQNPFKKVSLWYDVVQSNKHIIIHQLRAFYPKVFVDYDHNLFQKLQYKIYAFILPLVIKGSIYDRTKFWKKPMLKKASEIIIAHNIKQVICTGGPFGVMYYATLLKQKFKDLFLINDFRDPWTWGPNWGYPQLDKNRMAYEKELERNTIKNSDVISVPGEEMKQHIIREFPIYKEKVVCIPHFFDPNEVVVKDKSNSDKLRFIYYGTIYQGMEPQLKKISKLFSKYHHKATLDIYSDQHQHEYIFKDSGADNVSFHRPINPHLLFDKFSEFDFVLILNPAYNRNNISTKYYEIIATRTPMFVVSEKGYASEFITTNKLGICSSLMDVERNFEELIAKHPDFPYNANYNINKYSLENIALQINKILSTQCVVELEEGVIKK